MANVVEIGVIKPERVLALPSSRTTPVNPAAVDK